MSFLCQGLLEKGFIAKKMSFNAKRGFSFFIFEQKKIKKPFEDKLKKNLLANKTFSAKKICRIIKKIVLFADFFCSCAGHKNYDPLSLLYLQKDKINIAKFLSGNVIKVLKY